MARPRKDSGEQDARTRLANAFWHQLGSIPFSEMTARGISREAGVNHNTFYRYFDSIEDMAEALFDESVFEGLPAALLASVDGEGAAQAVVASGIGAEDLTKAALYARSGSELLTRLVRDALEHAWLAAADVDREGLDNGQRADLAIIFGGIVAAMGDEDIEPAPSLFAGVMSRPLGRGMLETLSALSRPGTRV